MEFKNNYSKKNIFYSVDLEFMLEESDKGYKILRDIVNDFDEKHKTSYSDELPELFEEKLDQYLDFVEGYKSLDHEAKKQINIRKEDYYTRSNSPLTFTQSYFSTVDEDFICEQYPEPNKTYVKISITDIDTDVKEKSFLESNVASFKSIYDMYNK